MRTERELQIASRRGTPIVIWLPECGQTVKPLSARKAGIGVRAGGGGIRKQSMGLRIPDSDYDVRFIYVRPEVEYLRLNPVRDIIELRNSRPGSLLMASWLIALIIIRFSSAARPLTVSSTMSIS